MGTPAGVAIKTGRWLKDGDVVEVGVSEVGTIVNNVIYEPNSKL
jgi:2-keto-4-pentenoate hydratase/2-oxohepta-3-ene-1,7-dioic acid hydratase in catechol pathway